MKTKNLELDLILPDQENKEVFLNENISTIDSFTNISVKAFIDGAPLDAYKNYKFIMTSGEHRNKICYANFEDKPWSYMQPKQGMVIFCQDLEQFFFFNGDIWKKIGNSEAEATVVGPRFEGAMGEFVIKKKFGYYYLSGDVNFVISRFQGNEIELVIKQNWERVHEINFDVRVLWSETTEYKGSRTPNLMDHIRLIKIPETEHFLGQIIHKGYRY